MTKITLLGIDIAKRVFQLHGIDKNGKALLKKKLQRSELKNYVANLPACRIVMEACGSAHYWAREFQSLGHDVKLISPQFVKPFVKTNKNDANDAQAICEAASRPAMRFVPIKGVEQQAIQSLHRVRERLVGQRTALSNQIRGLLAEYGVVLAKGIGKLRRELPVIIEDEHNELPPAMRELLLELQEEFIALERRVSACDKKVTTIFKANPVCQRLGKVEGIGPLTATILLTVLSDASLFKNGRHFAAFLGLVPKQQSSGGRERLLGISKRGDRYIRRLLIQGGQAAMRQSGQKTDPRHVWLNALHARRGIQRTCVALANKNARIAWALVAHGEAYEKGV